MATARCILERNDPLLAIYQPATDPRTRCKATIELDGTVYRCGRAHVDGIHDAFVQHHDGGAVRW